MEDVAKVLGGAKIFDGVIEVAEIPIGWFAAFCSSERYCGHDVWSAFGQNGKMPSKRKYMKWSAGCGGGSRAEGRGVWVLV